MISALLFHKKSRCVIPAILVSNVQKLTYSENKLFTDVNMRQKNKLNLNLG